MLDPPLPGGGGTAAAPLPTQPPFLSGTPRGVTQETTVLCLDSFAAAVSVGGAGVPGATRPGCNPTPFSSSLWHIPHPRGWRVAPHRGGRRWWECCMLWGRVTEGPWFFFVVPFYLCPFYFFCPILGRVVCFENIGHDHQPQAFYWVDHQFRD